MVQKLLGQLQGDGHGEKGIDLRGGGTQDSNLGKWVLCPALSIALQSSYAW